jgi:lipoyl(octanoyl) transferase
MIVPCGIADRGVTSLGRVLGREVTVADVRPAVEQALRSVFAHDGKPEPQFPIS